MKRTALLSLALALFAFYNYGLYQWIQSGHTFRDVWQAVTSDWFLTITVLDLAFFGLLCVFWLYRDMQRRGMSGVRRALIILATLITGVVVLLLYLAFHKTGDLKEA